MGVAVSIFLKIGDEFHKWFVDPHINVMSPDGATCMTVSLGSYITDYHIALIETYGEVTRHTVVTHQTNPVDLGERGLAFDMDSNHPLVIILGTLSGNIGHNYFMNVNEQKGKVLIGEGYIKLAVDKVMEYFRHYRLPVKVETQGQEDGNNKI